LNNYRLHPVLYVILLVTTAAGGAEPGMLHFAPLRMATIWAMTASADRNLIGLPALLRQTSRHEPFLLSIALYHRL
jgi:hypothetical protein